MRWTTDTKWENGKLSCIHGVSKFKFANKAGKQEFKKKRIQKNVSKYSTHWMDGTMGFIQNRKSLWIGYSNTKKVQQNEKTDAITTLNS